MSDDIQYPGHFIERLHTIWGEGFLSPGGPEEVGEELYTNWLGVRRGLAQAVSGGGLRPTHLRGVKPANLPLLKE